MEESRTQPAHRLVSRTNGHPHLQLRVSPGNGEAPPHREEGEALALSNHPSCSLRPNPAPPSSYLRLSKRDEPRTAPPMGNAPMSLPQSGQPPGSLRQRDSFTVTPAPPADAARTPGPAPTQTVGSTHCPNLVTSPPSHPCLSLRR